MGRKVRWSIRASDELVQTLSFWNEKNGNSRYSKYLFSEIEYVLGLVSTFPEIGRKSSREDIRTVSIDKKYALYYSYDNDYIEVKHWKSFRMKDTDFQA